MNTELLAQLIQLIIPIVVVIVSRYLVPFLKSKIDANKLQKHIEELELVAEWTFKYVNSAENIYTQAKQGNLKRETVTEWIVEFCNKTNISLSDAEIRAILETAYTSMINEKKKVEKPELSE